MRKDDDRRLCECVCLGTPEPGQCQKRRKSIHRHDASYPANRELSDVEVRTVGNRKDKAGKDEKDRHSDRTIVDETREGTPEAQIKMHMHMKKEHIKCRDEADRRQGPDLFHAAPEAFNVPIRVVGVRQASESVRGKGRGSEP
ncbi:hypothetical protein IZ6_31030 [Terrihabitans soli]|uniref:Uncharacterized protein n=1 Tax=Terrihabitans soli TaxID=708113 RepID=A0A6S6R070_9HYPH|nr:hypothetical protein IZ6_31030 [Terrihabitans soli]